jgi:hypothetical protein
LKNQEVTSNKGNGSQLILLECRQLRFGALALVANFLGWSYQYLTFFNKIGTKEVLGFHPKTQHLADKKVLNLISMDNLSLTAKSAK